MGSFRPQGCSNAFGIESLYTPLPHEEAWDRPKYRCKPWSDVTVTWAILYSDQSPNNIRKPLIAELKSHRLRFGDLDLRAHVKSSRTTYLM